MKPCPADSTASAFFMVKNVNETLQSVLEPTATRYLSLIYLEGPWEEKKYAWGLVGCVNRVSRTT